MENKQISYDEMLDTFRHILLKQGFNETKASACARIFTDNSLDGVYSHGVYRFLRFIEYIRKGYIRPDAEPELVSSAGALEQWDGNLASGPLNAMHCTERAMQLAEQGGLGCAAIANTNHWMRGGTYGWHAAKKGFAFIGWTNTIANMPAWGARDCRLGNNPLVLAVPDGNEAIVLDFAMSQYSYGKMEKLQLENQLLPTLGGYSNKGELTNDPSEILQSERPLPAGFWKGAGLSLLLDLLAALLSGGLSTTQISKREAEYGVSQVFIAFNLKKLSNYSSVDKAVREIIADVKGSISESQESEILYPGERVIRTRSENKKKGIPVNKMIWSEIRSI